MLGEQIKGNFFECVDTGFIHYVFENWSHTLDQNKLYLIEAGFV